MLPIRPLALVVLACLCVPADSLAALEPAATPGAQSRGKRGRGKQAVLSPYLGTYAAAKQVSLERNVPLLIHIILEGEAENDSYRDSVLHDAAITSASELAVVLIANNGEHDSKTVKETIEGRQIESQVCSSYPWFRNCAQHRAPWDDLYIAYHDEAGDLKLPQTIILMPGGEKGFRKHDGHPAEAKVVLSKLQRAQKLAGPGFTVEGLAKVKRLEKEALRATDAKLWGAAWREWQAVLTTSESGTFAERARSAMPALETHMAKELEGLVGKLVPGQAAAAYASLSELRLDWRETPAAGEVAKLMKRAEKDKAIKDEIREWRFEQEAQALLDEALEFQKQGDEKGLKKPLRKLFGKKYAATKAQAAAREAFPELAPKEGG